MRKMNLATVAKGIKTFTAKHSPEILTGLGIAGMITTTVLAVKATPKALMCLEDARYEKKDDLTVFETVKACWKPYLPAVLTGVTSTACLIGANSVSARRTAALTAAYQLSETALTEYREKVVETIGEKKEQAVREKVAEQKVVDNPVSKTDVIFTGKGSTRCFDPLSNHYFESDLEAIRRAENNLNKQLMHDVGGYVTVNDFFDELGLPQTELGKHMGWNSDHPIDLDITAHVGDDGKPAIVIGHYTPPKYEYCY